MANVVASAAVASAAAPVATAIMTKIERFWQTMEKNTGKLTQPERYEAHGSPAYIKKFIAMGGGPRMGSTLEQYARFNFPLLRKRNKGKGETGYDQIIPSPVRDIYVEQKSSGHWGEDDYKWQHVESKHKWDVLLLCGIDYTDIRFWFMDRATFIRLIAAKKITNQGNKTSDSSEGMWFNYSDVKDELKEIKTEADLLQFAAAVVLE
jgi:hypothetical protein